MGFRDNIPEELLSDSVYADKYIQILDELAVDKDILIEMFRRFHSPILNPRTSFLKRFIKGLGDLSLVPGIPRKVLEDLILRSWHIYSLKGSTDGLILFLNTISIGRAIINTSKMYTTGAYIIPDDIVSGYQMLSNLSTPTSDEYGDYVATIGLDEDSFLFLFEDTLINRVPLLEICLLTPFANILEFREWLTNILPEFVPLSKENADIRVYLYNKIPLDPTLYFIK